MKLSKRLELIESLVTKGNKVADIGTDHAFIPISLVEKGIVSKAIAMDVAKGPLLKASTNIKEHGLENQISTRLSNGLDKLELGEVDTIIIAGMGADLIVDILKRGEKFRSDIKEYILSPHSEWDKLRKFLRENEYKIIEEKMIIDDNKYYVVVKAIPSLSDEISFSSNDDLYNYDMYGKFLLDKKNQVLKSYLIKEEALVSKVLEEFRNFDKENLKDKALARYEELLFKRDNINNILKKVYQYET